MYKVPTIARIGMFVLLQHLCDKKFSKAPPSHFLQKMCQKIKKMTQQTVNVIIHWK